MKQWPDDYLWNLSSRAGELLRELNRRIREEINHIEFSSCAREYVAYKAPGMKAPFAYSDRRDRDLFVHLRICLGEIEDPHGVCEKGTALPPFYTTIHGVRTFENHVQVKIDSSRRIDDTMCLLRQALQHNKRHN